MGGYGSGRPATRPLAEHAAAVTVEDAQGLGLAGLLVLVERPGRGACLYLRCKRCRGLARVLYHDGPDRPLGCRRCVRPVYRSSRRSDARVSAILRDPEAIHRYAVGGGFAGDLAGVRMATAGLFVLLKLADRYWREHKAAGRPWSAARRAAYERGR